MAGTREGTIKRGRAAQKVVPATENERQDNPAWRQFLTSKKKMLDAFDKARQHARAHEVETYHGDVAEEEWRRWLADFLPKRYGVTAGYVVSQGVAFERFPHYDVIIYDQLESPVLWIEEGPSGAPAGASRAIPAEHVRGVIEVKAALGPKSAKAAVKHLRDLAPLLAGLDSPGERYKKFLPPTFFSAIVFFDLREKYQFQRAVLDHLNPPDGAGLRGFRGGLLLRGEGLPFEHSCRLQIVAYKATPGADPGEQKASLLSHFTFSRPNSQSPESDRRVMTLWGGRHFGEFAFDLVALLDGTYQAGKVSSFHAMNIPGLMPAGSPSDQNVKG
jgi:hypothetical protein